MPPGAWPAVRQLISSHARFGGTQLPVPVPSRTMKDHRGRPMKQLTWDKSARPEPGTSRDCSPWADRTVDGSLAGGSRYGTLVQFS